MGIRVPVLCRTMIITGKIFFAYAAILENAIVIFSKCR